MTYDAPPRRPGRASPPAGAAVARRVAAPQASGPAASAEPLRFPDLGDPGLMTRRAWWLVGLNVLVPGAPQVLAGDRRLGRVGLGATLLGWALVLLALVVLATGRAHALTFFTNAWVLTIVQVLLVAYLLLWAVLTVDTVRLARLVRVPSRMRLAVPAAALVVLVGILALGGTGVATAAAARGAISGIFGGDVAQAPVDGRYNILLLGGDDGADRDGMRPDSTTVASVDAKTGQTVLIGLPRDLKKVPFPEDSPMHALFPDGYGVDRCQASVCMLNSIYTEVSVFHPDLYPDAAKHGSQPGWEAMRDAAEGITGLQIQYLVVVDMAGFQKLIDALGGVTINVEEKVPIGGQKDDLSDVEGWIQPGVQKLDGWHALWYARARHGTSDYDRMARQKVVEEAVLRQFDPATVVTKFESIASAGSEVLSTTVPQSMVGAFVDLAVKAKDTDLVKVEITPASSVDPDDPDWDYVRQLVQQGIAKAGGTS